MRRITNLTIPCMLLLTAMLSTSVFAQTTTSTIEGTVKDPSGALVPGATVKVTAETLASERNATTDSNGRYRIAALPAGKYTIAVSAQGFAVSTTEIELTLNRILTYDVSLQVGSATQTVNVSSAPPLIDQDRFFCGNGDIPATSRRSPRKWTGLSRFAAACTRHRN